MSLSPVIAVHATAAIGALATFTLMPQRAIGHFVWSQLGLI